jgi:hypothetical protein
MFLLWGVRGQRIIVDPQSKLVMVNTAVHKRALDIPPLREMGHSGPPSCVSSAAFRMRRQMVFAVDHDLPVPYSDLTQLVFDGPDFTRELPRKLLPPRAKEHQSRRRARTN